MQLIDQLKISTISNNISDPKRFKNENKINNEKHNK